MWSTLNNQQQQSAQTNLYEKDKKNIINDYIIEDNFQELLIGSFFLPSTP